MALGTPVLTSASIAMVGATASPAPAIPIGGLLSWAWAETQPTTERRYIGQAAAIAIGAISRVVTINCDYETADTGQDFLHDSKVSGATVYFKALPDGTNGEILPVKVTRPDMGAPDADSYHTVTFVLNQQAAVTVVGTGFGT